MTVQERNNGAVSGVVNVVLGLVAIAVLGIIGLTFWPKIQAAYQSAPVQVQHAAPVAPQAAPVRAPAPVYAPAPVIVQQVPAGEAPQPIQVQPAPQAAPAPVQVDSAAPVQEAAPAPPPPAPIVIVHQVSQDGSHQTITGSGACKVARVAARCGDK